MASPMTNGRRADSARRRERVLKALDILLRSDNDITVSNLARAAKVDRTFLYRHRDLLDVSTRPLRRHRRKSGSQRSAGPP